MQGDHRNSGNNINPSTTKKSKKHGNFANATNEINAKNISQHAGFNNNNNNGNNNTQYNNNNNNNNNNNINSGYHTELTQNMQQFSMSPQLLII